MKRIIIILLGAIFAISASAEIYTTVSSERIEIKTPKPPRIHPKFEFYAKVGANIMNASGWNDLYWPGYYERRFNIDHIDGKSAFGVDVAFGFMSHFRPSRPSNFYWGAELSITQVGGGFNEFDSEYTSRDYDYNAKGYNVDYTLHYPSTTVVCWGAAISPTIGWKKELVKGVSLDLHFNPGILGNLPKDIEYGVTRYNNDNKGEYEYYGKKYALKGDLNVALKGGFGFWFNKFNIDISYRGLIPISWHLNYSNVIISLGYKF